MLVCSFDATTPTVYEVPLRLVVTVRMSQLVPAGESDTPQGRRGCEKRISCYLIENSEGEREMITGVLL
jgi:hypothetical protein